MRETRSVFGAGAFAGVVATASGDVEGVAVDVLVADGASAVVTGADFGGADVVTVGRAAEVLGGSDCATAAVEDDATCVGAVAGTGDFELAAVEAAAVVVVVVVGFLVDVPAADVAVDVGVDVDVGAGVEAAVDFGASVVGTGADVVAADATVVVPDFAGLFAATVLAVGAAAFVPFLARPFAPFVAGSVDATATAGAADGTGIAATATASPETRRITNRPDPSVPRRCQMPRAESP